MDQSNNSNPMQPQQPAPAVGDPNAIPGAPTAPISNPAPVTDPTASSVPQPTPVMPTTTTAPMTGQPTPPIDPTAPQAIDPTLQPTQPMTPQPIQETKSGGSGKKIMILIIGLIVLLGLGAAVYFLVIKKPSAEPMTIENVPTPTPIPDQTLIEKEVGETPEEQEVIDIEEVSVDEEFQTIDQNLQQL